MLPLDPIKAEEYRAKQRENRLRQVHPWPKGSKRPPEAKANMSVAAKDSPSHRSKHQRGVRNTNFRGGFLDKNGYRVISFGKRGEYRMEHRVVMERMIGRPLTSEETVHHKNGNRSDNRESNLELWSSRNPKGQRVVDKIRYAQEILALYGEDFAPEDELLS